MTDFAKNKMEKTSKYGDEEIFAYCDHCGFAIYSLEDALIISATDDRIHAECWPEYAEEHMFCFAQKASDDDRYVDAALFCDCEN